MLKFVAPLIVVEDVAAARAFYEETLGQTVRFDFGEDVQFEGEFSIHQRAHFQRLLGEPERFPVTRKAHAAELYFEAAEIEAVFSRLKAAGAEFIHEVQEQPWGQRVMRLYDPDGHVLEIGESMEAAVVRLHQQGLSVDGIAQKTGMPNDFIERAIAG